MITRQANFIPESANKDEKTIEVVWSSGAPVLRGYGKQQHLEVLELDGAKLDRFNNGAPVLNSHNSRSLSDQLGVVEKAWVEEGKGKAKIRFSSRSDVEPIYEDIIGGIIRNISIGYKILKQELEEKKDEVNVLRVKQFELFELSFVPIPADGSAQTRSDEEMSEESVIKQERERVLGILSLKADQEQTEELVCKGVSVGDAAIQVRKKELSHKNTYIDSLKKAEEELEGIRNQETSETSEESVSSLLKLATKFGV